VHDVNGDLRKTHEGCGVFFEAKGDGSSHFDGLLIEQCRVERTDRNGICQRGSGWNGTRSRNVIIRNNRLDDIGGDGIKLWGTNGGIIENNVVRNARARCVDHAAGIWPFACDDTLIQFNEVSGTKGTKDGQGFDADYHCRRSVFQYNYSHNNEGGFILVCGTGKSFNESPVVRYNISVHDGVDSARVFHFGGKSTNAHVYNNTIIIGAHQDLPMILQTQWEGGICESARFTNNLLIVEPGGRASYDFTHGKNNVFENNLFCGRHEGLPAGASIAPSPKLTGSVTAAPGFASLQGCRPADPNSFPRGSLIKDNGGRDFFGSPLPMNQPPAIGACEK
jgi:parallel beta-helix repeat protein